MLDERLVLFFQQLIRGDQERAAAARRIDHRDLAKRIKAFLPIDGEGIRWRRPHRLFPVDVVFLGQRGEAFLDHHADGVLHDESSEIGRRVVDAEALALGTLGHRRPCFDRDGEERAADADLLDLADALLKQMAEYVNVHVFGEIKFADVVENRRPLVFEI